MNSPKHEISKIEEYQKKGYTTNFQFEDNGLIDSDTQKKYTQDEVTIVEEYRYEGMSDPSDMSILYILETKDGKKGTILMAYGPSADYDAAQWFNKLLQENK